MPARDVVAAARPLRSWACAIDTGALANADLADELSALARSYDVRRSARAYAAVDQALAALERNASPKVVADWLVLQL